jgi:xanthine dehydrogenase/oxidase
MFVTEAILSTVAEGLSGIDIDELRLKNLYKPGDRTPFFQQIDEDWHIPTLLDQIRASSNYDSRKAKVAKFNESNKWKKRGICLIPTKFGLSFATALHLNQAGATVNIYADGSVLLHHGGTEMGQGLYTKMCQVAAQELGVPMDSIYTYDSQTYQIANASPTAASSGSDLNGMAVKNACEILNERLKPYREKYGLDAPMRTIAHAAYFDRVNLAANGFWKMSKIGYQWGDTNVDTVKPMYYYFTQGVGVTEVELDLLTGDHTVLRTDIMMVSSASLSTYQANDFNRMSANLSIQRSTMDKSKALSFKVRVSSQWKNLSGLAPASLRLVAPALIKSLVSPIFRKSSMSACCDMTAKASP